MKIPMALSALAFASVLAISSDSAEARKPKKDNTAEISGSWAGRLRTKAFSFAAGGETERSSQALTFDITNDQGNLTITAVYETDEGAETFTLHGVAGNNSFWATGQDEDHSETVTFSGHINARGNHLVGVGIETAADEVSEFQFNVKRQ